MSNNKDYEIRHLNNYLVIINKVTYKYLPHPRSNHYERKPGTS
jgi:hypothetical protein